jgi:outer membrane lipoprotein SlyB
MNGFTSSPAALALAATLMATGLTGCVIAPPRYVERASMDSTPIMPPSTEVRFHATAGQDSARQDRDRYECYRWAMQASSVDPGSTQFAPHQRLDVVSATPPGANTAGGTVSGAILGAAASRPHAVAGGALIGAIAGALIGATVDAESTAQAQRAQQQLDQREARDDAQFDQDANDFRRAMSACLVARGYTTD